MLGCMTTVPAPIPNVVSMSAKQSLSQHREMGNPFAPSWKEVDRENLSNILL